METTADRTAASQERNASSRACALIVGLALHNAWVCSAMYSASMFGTAVNFTGVRGASFSLLYIVSSVGFFITSIIACCIDQRLTRYSRSRRHMLLAAAITCVSTLLSLVPHVAPEPVSLVVEVLAGLATGVGSAVLMLYWGTALAREDEALSAPATLAGLIGGFALNVLVLQALPNPAGGLAAAALPLLEYACLAHASPGEHDPVSISFNALPTSKTKFGLVVAEATVLMGLAIALLKQASIQTTFSGTTSPSKFVILVMSACVAAVPLVIFRMSSKKGDWQFLLRRALPITTCVILLAALAMGEQDLFFEMFMVAAYFLCEALVWLFGVFTAHRLRLSPIFLFGLLRGGATASMLVGAIVIQYASGFLDTLPPNGKGFVVIVVVLILFATRLLPREADMVRTVVRCPAVRLMATDMDERLRILAERKAAEQQVQAGGSRDGAMAPDVPVGVAGEAGGGRGYAGGPSARSPFDAQARQGGEAGGKFSRKVRRVAETYMLTERETDILFEWVKGNGAPYIQEKYSISEGTVKTHIRNIYRKLNVHKKSDLMRLIEEIEDYD